MTAVGRNFMLLGTMLWFCAGGAEAATVNLNPSKDNTILSELSTSSNATGGIFVGMTDHTGGIRRGLIRFNTSGIPAGSTISNVTLTLTYARGVGSPVSLHKLTADWGEGTSGGTGQGSSATTNDATWNVRFFGSASNWTTPGGDFNATASATASTSGPTIVWNSTASMVTDVQSWVNTPAANFGWLLKGNETSIHTTQEFNSRESATGQPVLSVTYITAGVDDWGVY